MAATFKFDLVSPERVLMSAEAEQVVLTGTEGEFSVLAGHAPLVSALLPGIVHATLPNAKKAIYIKGGFAEVTPTSLSLLVDSAFVTDEADARQIDSELDAVEKALSEADDDEARVHFDRALKALKSLKS